jgi:hypothetical protein
MMVIKYDVTLYLDAFLMDNIENNIANEEKKTNNSQ